MRPQGVLDGGILGRVLIMGILHGNVAVGVARRVGGRRHWGNGGGGLWLLGGWVQTSLLVRIILESGRRLLLGLDPRVVGVVAGGHGHLAVVVCSPGRAALGRVRVWLPLLLHGCWLGRGPARRTELVAVIWCGWSVDAVAVAGVVVVAKRREEEGGRFEAVFEDNLNPDGLGSLAGGRSQVWA